MLPFFKVMLLALTGQGLTSKLGTECNVVVGYFTSVCRWPTAISHRATLYIHLWMSVWWQVYTPQRHTETSLTIFNGRAGCCGDENPCSEERKKKRRFHAFLVPVISGLLRMPRRDVAWM